ncbi:MAG: hypothetical protein JWO08_1542 [Verrucomicrobiaceae bacterium]|nr:hypothetical protein [Verrucomicrobiaceae bacterium]
MTYYFAAAPSIFFLLCASIVHAAPPRDLVAARERYDKSRAAATQPINSRYSEELNQLKTQALANKNLDAVIAIDAEIAAVANKPSSSNVSNVAVPRLSAARDRYNAAIASATKPVLERYLQELEQLKNKALAQKDLPAAVAIDAEISDLVKTTPIREFKTAKDLASFLEDTVWTWGLSAASAESKIRFRKNGTFSVNSDPPSTWEAESSTSVRLGFGGRLRFSSDHKRFEGTLNGGGRRAGRLLSP